MPAATAVSTAPPPIAKTASAAEDSHSKSNSRSRMRNLFRRNKSQPDKPSAADLLEKALEEAKHSPVKQQQQQQRLSTPIRVVSNNNTPTTQKAVTVTSQDDAKKGHTHDEKKDLHKSFLCRTKFFKEMIQSSFELVDQDGSGTIDEKELYSGLLLIHLKLGTYAGPAACKVRNVFRNRILLQDSRIVGCVGIIVLTFFLLFFSMDSLDSQFHVKNVTPSFRKWIRIIPDIWTGKNLKMS